MSILKRILKAFAVGAGAGLVGQILMALVSLAVSDTNLVTMISMLLFGFIGFALIAAGLYTPIARFGGDGAAIPLCGLMYGAAATSAGAQKAGMPASKAFRTGFLAIFKVLGTGFVIALVIGLIWHPAASAGSGAGNSGVLAFLGAMLIGGCICMIAQILSECKVPFPVTAILLVAMGGLLTPLGVIDRLALMGAGGAAVTAVGCGNGAYGAGAALAGGTVITFILVAALNIILVLLGAAAGGVLLKKHPECVPDAPTKD